VAGTWFKIGLSHEQVAAWHVSRLEDALTADNNALRSSGRIEGNVSMLKKGEGPWVADRRHGF
jgi:hypothetical protein